MTAPRARLVQRPINQALYQEALAEGVHPLQARILAGRLESIQGSLTSLVKPALKYLASPQSLKDIDRACQRLLDALQSGQRIGILTDYDVDGITSHVVIYRSLTEYFGVPPEKISSLIGHRIKDGYGVSDALVNRILDQSPRPEVIITADCGSSDEPRLARLKQAGIDVLVTDHHALPKEGPPPSAFAVINPTRSDCSYPDPTLAGCAVSWLLMSAFRSRLIEAGLLDAASPKLSALLPFVALGTVADCVSLGGSAANRAFVTQGLKLMNASDAPCWQAFREFQGERFDAFTAATLGFQLGPRINARSRMADPYAALHFLLASNLPEARRQLEVLDSDNQDRRFVEAEMTRTALDAALLQVKEGFQTLVTYVAEGHSGVQGIVASRLVEKLGRPAVVLTPGREAGHLNASARSVPGIYLREALQRVDDLHPGLLVRFGGHQGAAGLTLWSDKLAAFQQAFEQAIRLQLNGRTLEPSLYTDGELPDDLLCLETLDILTNLEPFGREFDPPLFEGLFVLEAIRTIGADQTHLLMEVASLETGKRLKAIWFRALSEEGEALPVTEGQQVRLAYRLDANHFRGKVSLQLLVSQAYVEAC
ncbi:single-stranded-DNA-specific exonuclease [Marinospirillum celere]|uniref:Single-stranded-DNA-specific exonuclease RecJ n=1 Tax=Marinospirillum celere TaxID=1122252 RepID=A0A1I1HDM3_9GAMM|nr:single-stranded-DNA-specific exonuclease RecJ [Marinospirillum celere]SFC21722.1 single-stranded-DNA-specific exonuclease [Marinospirillum celere]